MQQPAAKLNPLLHIRLADAISQFRDAMLAAGLAPPNVIEPGKIQRFPGAGKRPSNRAGWCIFFDDRLGGRFGDLSLGFTENWLANRSKPPLTAETATFSRGAM